MLSSRFGIDNTFSDYDEMLSSLNPDAVFVCTPNKFHSSATVSALRSGSHVFCEKPPPSTLESSRNDGRLKGSRKDSFHSTSIIVSGVKQSP